MERKGALIAMSGGVDSSVAAYLMQAQGCDCVGATMRLYRNEGIGLGRFRTCCAQRDIDDASEVAFHLDIPYEVLDFTSEFKEQVIGRSIRVYEAGGTPDPCIDCNRYMKFEELLRFAREKGLDHVVTGHYARIAYDEATGRWLLKKAVDESKDQSYVLYMNVSVRGVKGTVFQRALAAHGVCVSVRSACATDVGPSEAVYAVSRDRKNALSSWRISLSHRSTEGEVAAFLKVFDRCYRELVP